MTLMEAILTYPPGTRLRYGYDTGLVHGTATVIEVDPESPPNKALLLIKYDNDPHYPDVCRVDPDYYAVIDE
jgi:hypothetical protein